MKVFVTISRILVGLLFIVSGLIKANDPIGFSYKLDEYWQVFGMEWMSPLSLAISVFICVAEVVLGVAVLVGAQMVLVSWALLLMIVFFTFLTFYSAYFNKVTDCGCFGDAIKLTPWESFTKDVVLLIFILIIFFYRNKIKSVFNSKKIDWAIIILTTVGAGYFSYYCINHLPVKDFRPYAVGKNIKEQMTLPEGAKKDIYEITLVYKNTVTGEVKEFSQSNYPWQDSTWVWQETINKLVQKGDHPPIHDFNIIDADGNDITEDILNDPQPIFLVVCYNLNKTNKKAFEKINPFTEACFNNGFSIIGLTASSAETIDNFKHEVQSMLDFYNVDETTLKTMIRSNPGIMLLKQGTVVAMWHHNDTPDFNDVKAKYLN
ncbi:MAG: BT_3928 family protein [Bacteroidia bacterium]